MLREYIYVDIVRVRSLLAQMDAGVVERAVESRTEATDKKIGANVMGVGGADRISGESVSVEHSRSMQELIFSVFEEIAESSLVLRDLPTEDVADERWADGTVHSSLVEGEIVRLFTPVLLVDTAFLSQRLQRFAETTAAVGAFQTTGLSQKMKALREQWDAETDEAISQLTGGRDQRKNAERQLRRNRDSEWQKLQAEVECEADELIDTESMENVRRFLEAYLSSDSIEVRFLAAGSDAPERSFAGSLLARDEYIQRERDALYSRYGSVLEGWTSVVQIARIPSEEEGEAARERDFSDIEFTEGTMVNRSKLLQAAVQLTGMLEAQGIAEGPLWPTVSVIPLAIYRSVPRSDSF